MSKSIIDLMREVPGLEQKVLELGAIGRDESLPAATRMLAFAQVSELMAPLMIEAAKQSLAPPGDDKPKYRWVNGARVRIQ